MSENKKGFYAYAASPAEIGSTIEAALQQVQGDSDLTVESWKALDIVGHFISQQVTEKIENSDFVIADISTLNFNVTYEIGYAIGCGKRILLTKNRSLKETFPTIADVGIFDTLGYQLYQNSDELKGFIRTAIKVDAIKVPSKLSLQAPVYLVDGLHKTDIATRVISRIKKAGFIFRSFDPNEQPRLSGYDAIEQVSQSYGVVVPLLSVSSDNSEIHNMRGAFIAGLAAGMEKALCILQYRADPVPLDVRDFVNTASHPNDIDEFIAQFASKVAEAFQQVPTVAEAGEASFLQSLDLGSSSAENEMRTLKQYYLHTDQFEKARRGEANIVVGRKGSGKTAIFLQIRDKERVSSKNIVLDLKPDGYKLIKFKELILTFLEEGTYQHTVMAFWEYVLLLEICYKILECDRELHKKNHYLYEPYRALADLYNADEYSTTGDFSERMSALMEKITSDYKSKFAEGSNVRLSSAQLTELLYFHDIQELRQQVITYMKQKDLCWLLFDNIDKGWPTTGLEPNDLLIIRALIDATRKIAREFEKNNIETKTIVFLRNDVYELLVKNTSDRGKDADELLDWTDPDLLRELVKLRLISNKKGSTESIRQLWSQVCVSHHRSGEETLQFMIDRSLMRPRFLLNLLSYCKGCASNLNHDRIESEDIDKGLHAYSTDLLTDISYEINDVQSGLDDILYAFIGSKSQLSFDALKTIVMDYGIAEENVKILFELLLWYGFIGIIINGQSKYIFDFHYSMKILLGLYNKNKDSIFVINPAFWSSLMIEES